MNKELTSEEVKRFKSANLAYKLKLAERWDTTVEDIVSKYYTKRANPKVLKDIKKEEIVSEKPVIHNITLLDATGSMGDYGGKPFGDKYAVAMKGIKHEVDNFNTTEDYTVKHSLIEFIEEYTPLKIHYVNIETVTNINFNGAKGNNTPLYWAIIETIKLFNNVSKSDKVLLKIYTDGENNRQDNLRDECSTLIKEKQLENFTITFVATNSDLKGIRYNLDLDESNTLSVTNDTKGFEKAFKTSNEATKKYANKVTKGEDVSTGFYLEVV